jgi:hypothetical protein
MSNRSEISRDLYFKGSLKVKGPDQFYWLKLDNKKVFINTDKSLIATLLTSFKNLKTLKMNYRIYRIVRNLKKNHRLELKYLFNQKNDIGKIEHKKSPLANRRGKDWIPNEPFDSNTPRIRHKDQPYEA